MLLPSGPKFRTLSTRLDVGADVPLRLESVSETAAYVSTLPAEGGSDRPSQRIAVDAVTRLILADLPLLREVDDTTGTG